MKKHFSRYIEMLFACFQGGRFADWGPNEGIRDQYDESGRPNRIWLRLAHQRRKRHVMVSSSVYM